MFYFKSGCVRFDFYDDVGNYLESCIVGVGDVFLLVGGGYGY